MNKNLSRYDFDINIVEHKGYKIPTFLNSKKVEALIYNIENSYVYEVGRIPAGYEHRPDLISNVFYSTPAYWWLLMQVNGVSDPLEGFNVGDRILIPKLNA